MQTQVAHNRGHQRVGGQLSGRAHRQHASKVCVLRRGRVRECLESVVGSVVVEQPPTHCLPGVGFSEIDGTVCIGGNLGHRRLVTGSVQGPRQQSICKWLSQSGRQRLHLLDSVDVTFVE